MKRVNGVNVVALVLLSLRGQVLGQAQYGVDCSFPMHSRVLRCPRGVDLGDREAFYQEYMQGCRDYYGENGFLCDESEHDRLEMSLGQPQSLVNFTERGYLKIKAPESVMRLLLDHWEANKDKKIQEQWTKGNIYVNHWKSPTYMVSVENEKLRGGGDQLRSKVWGYAKSTIQEWTQMELRPTSMYGIRVYTEGAVLSPHVDRLPLVSSAIINVAQDVDEPWPLEVIDRFGNAVNVTMEPGDMVLYESASTIHARPYPLKGRFFASIFIHFEPTGRPLYDDGSVAAIDHLDPKIPPYMLPNSSWADQYKEKNPYGWKRTSPSAPRLYSNAREPHIAAATGDIQTLQRIVQLNKNVVHRRDENGWQSIHEAVRGGHKEAVELLIKHGADVNARTGHDSKGQSPMNIAIGLHPRFAPIMTYLRSVGAKDIPPDEL